MLIRSFGTLSERILCARLLTRYRPAEETASITAVVVGIVALMFDAVTPQIISVGLFYVGLVLIGF